MNCDEESGRCFVVAGGDCSVLFELFEEVLDRVAGLVEVLFRLILKWLRKLWTKIIAAVIAPIAPVSAFKNAS